MNRNFSYANRLASFWRYAALALLLGFTLESSAGPVTLAILPASPKGQEDVRLRAAALDGVTYEPFATRVTMNANKITVLLKSAVGFGSEPVPPLEIALGRFPAGTYQVELQLQATSQPFVLATTQFTVSDENVTRATPYPFVDYTDLWWVPTESGWGMGITQMNDKLFATWYVYDPVGRPVWYTLQAGTWTFQGIFLPNFIYSGTVYKTTGPYFGNMFTPSSVTITPVGSGKLTFTSYDQAKFEYTVEGITGSKSIVRFEF